MPRIRTSRSLSPISASIDDGYFADVDEPVGPQDNDQFESNWDSISRREAALQFFQDGNQTARAINVWEEHGICAIGTKGDRVMPPASYLQMIYEKIAELGVPVYAIFYMSAGAVVGGELTPDHATWLDLIRKVRPPAAKPTSGSLGATRMTFERQRRFLLSNFPKKT